MSNAELDYTRKLYLIENCIYGVDIQPIAVQLTKLRCFITLASEQKADPTAPNFGIKPLPNLETRFIAANALLGLGESDKITLLGDMTKKADTIRAALDVNRHKLFYEYIMEKKRKLRKEDERLRKELQGELKSIGFGDSAAQRIADWEPFNKEVSAPWFNAKWMYGVETEGEKGFDVVLGNPPYISAPQQIIIKELLQQREKLINCNEYKSLYQKWDIYIAFIEKALHLCKTGGITTMIVPLQLTNQVYGKKLRELLTTEFSLYKIVDLSGEKVFKNATVTNCIPFILNQKSATQTIEVIKSVATMQTIDTFERTYKDLIPDVNTAVWNLEKQEHVINRHADMHTLGDFCFISYGLRPNSDDKTAKGEFKKADLISDTKDKIHCREYIEGKDIDNYIVKRVRYFEWNTSRSPDRLVVPTFREFYKYPKLMFNRLGSLHAYYDTNALIHNDSIIGAVLWKDFIGLDNINIRMSIKKFCHIKNRKEMEALSEKMSLLYLLAIFNSKYAQTLLNNIRGTDYHIYPNHIRSLPVPFATPEEQKTLGDLAQKILDAKAINIDADTSELETQIDKIVYKLYKLTDEEIAMIGKEK